MQKCTKVALVAAMGMAMATPLAASPAIGRVATPTGGATLVQDRDRRSDRDRRRWDDRRRGGFNLYIGPGGPGLSYGRGRNCGWLRQRAIATGSNYWWRRYRDCRYWR